MGARVILLYKSGPARISICAISLSGALGSLVSVKLFVYNPLGVFLMRINVVKVYDFSGYSDACLARWRFDWFGGLYAAAV